VLLLVFYRQTSQALPELAGVDPLSLDGIKYGAGYLTKPFVQFVSVN
jgi:hypothetical protein